MAQSQVGNKKISDRGVQTVCKLGRRNQKGALTLQSVQAVMASGRNSNGSLSQYIVKLKLTQEKEVPIETPLWRYMKLSTFFLLLMKNRVFIPSLKNLQTGNPKELWMRTIGPLSRSQAAGGSEDAASCRSTDQIMPSREQLP